MSTGSLKDGRKYCQYYKEFMNAFAAIPKKMHHSSGGLRASPALVFL
ncbi:MAG: hypothetical protein ABIJ31_13785 [Pseudomonadota bacterium]